MLDKPERPGWEGGSVKVKAIRVPLADPTPHIKLNVNLKVKGNRVF